MSLFSCAVTDIFDRALTSSASAEATTNMDGDAALVAFLSSQRNMLMILNSELGQHNSGHYQGHYMDQAVVGPHLHLVNTSNFDRRLSEDLLRSKRFSLDLGGASDHFPTISLDAKGSFDKDYDMRGVFSKSFKKREQSDTDHDDNTFLKKKRRLSSLGFLSASFFEDHAKASRRDSIATIATFASAASMHGPAKKETDDASVMSEMGDDDADDSMALMTLGRITECEHRRHALSEFKISVTELKDIMDGFAESMVKSQKSQQAIHDWDKKMGLKRSHSKTMRLSMRSRKKLKAMLKKSMYSMAV